MTKRIARVFPRKTNMSPKDPLAFFGMPTLDAMAMDIDEIHISVTFTWDLEAADALYQEWQILGVPVEVGGPAFGDRMGDFTPGMYLKEGFVFTSRGCTKDCWFCEVPKCSHGVIRELPICDGWNIMDDNILGTSEAHFRAVIDMLQRQPVCQMLRPVRLRRRQIRAGPKADGADHGAGFSAICHAVPWRIRGDGQAVEKVSAGMGESLYRGE